MRRLIAACVVAGAAALAAAGPAAAEPAWAPAATAPIHPGVQTDTNGGQCTANFVFFDGSDNVYIGQAAHCSGTDGNTATNGCEAGSLPHGTPVNVDGATRPGTIVYSSWVAMQAAGETDADTCQNNDIALIRLEPGRLRQGEPQHPVLGRADGTGRNHRPGRQGALVRQLVAAPRASRSSRPRRASASAPRAVAGRTRSTPSRPGIPGDSGSAFVDRQGRAFGVLSTLQLAPLVGANGVSDLSRMVAYMESHGGPDVTLARGTTAFRGPLLP